MWNLQCWHGSLLLWLVSSPTDCLQQKCAEFSGQEHNCITQNKLTSGNTQSQISKRMSNCENIMTHAVLDSAMQLASAMTLPEPGSLPMTQSDIVGIQSAMTMLVPAFSGFTFAVVFCETSLCFWFCQFAFWNVVLSELSACFVKHSFFSCFIHLFYELALCFQT